MTLSTIVLVVLLMMRVRARWGSDCIDHFSILPTEHSSFACRTTAIATTRAMLGIEVSEYVTSEPDDVAKYTVSYARTPRWQHVWLLADWSPFKNWFTTPPMDSLRSLDLLGVHSEKLVSSTVTESRSTVRLGISWWAAIPLASVFPAATFLAFVRRARRHRYRVRRGLCADCGYDLRSSPARCPECGRTTITGSA